MPPLKMLRDGTHRLTPKVGYLQRSDAQVSRARDAAFEWRGWYKTARWQRLRWSVLVRDQFTCQWPGCGRLMADTSLLVADHRVPHRGNPDLFWDEANLQCLCKPCHDRAKQRAEARARAGGGGV